MIIGTLFTLFVVPSIYVLLARKRAAAIVPAAEEPQDLVPGHITEEGAAA
jgi:hypothetical protein